MKATDGVIIVRSHDIWKKTKSSLELKDYASKIWTAGRLKGVY